MKRRDFLQTMLSSTVALSLPDALPADSNPHASLPPAVPQPSHPLVLWYQQPAQQWIDALPLGNGRLGAMVFGGTATERIQLNEDTVWSGGPYDPTNPQGPQALPEIRRNVFAGNNIQAHRLFGRSMFGLAIPQMQYQPLGNLWLTFKGQSHPSNHRKQLATDMAITAPNQVSDYRRQLDLDQAIVTTQYRVRDLFFTRESFVSPVDQVVVLRLTANQRGKISLSAALTAGNDEQRKGDARYDVILPDEIVVRGRTMSDAGIDGCGKTPASSAQPATQQIFLIVSFPHLILSSRAEPRSAPRPSAHGHHRTVRMPRAGSSAPACRAPTSRASKGRKPGNAMGTNTQQSPPVAMPKVAQPKHRNSCAALQKPIPAA